MMLLVSSAFQTTPLLQSKSSPPSKATPAGPIGNGLTTVWACVGVISDARRTTAARVFVMTHLAWEKASRRARDRGVRTGPSYSLGYLGRWPEKAASTRAFASPLP